MPRRSRPARLQNTDSAAVRAEVAHAAARLIVDEGLDHGFAKRKALRQLGLPANMPLPTNAEVDAAVRDEQSLYQEEGEQEERIARLRRAAADLMRILAPFSPWLTGSVLDGTAGRHAHIDLLLFPDSAKEVEIFLLDHGIPFRHGRPKNDRVEAVLLIDDDDTPANLIVLPPREERIQFKTRDGRSHERVRLDAVEALCAA